MSQIQLPKLNMWVRIGSPEDYAVVSKFNMYVRLSPGEGDDSSNRQGHIQTRIIRRT